MHICISRRFQHGFHELLRDPKERSSLAALDRACQASAIINEKLFFIFLSLSHFGSWDRVVLRMKRSRAWEKMRPVLILVVAGAGAVDVVFPRLACFCPPSAVARDVCPQETCTEDPFCNMLIDCLCMFYKPGIAPNSVKLVTLHGHGMPRRWVLDEALKLGALEDFGRSRTRSPAGEKTGDR